jgi:hypothetical protein
MPSCYVYVVDRDFGFAPNPFHGYCTLATCKPGIRSKANVGDWVVGIGGARLSATGRCIYSMRVTDIVSFDEYWSNPQYRDKKPVRNGSRKMLVGDNIYHRSPQAGAWQQAHSHHSNPDGSPNLHNIANDTRANRVLISRHFLYFGRCAPSLPATMLAKIGYRNVRNYRVFRAGEFDELLDWLISSYGDALNMVLGDPFDFDHSERHYSAHGNNIL